MPGAVIQRIAATLLFGLIFLTPGMFGVYLIFRSIEDAEVSWLLLLTGFLLAVASLFWFIKRTPLMWNFKKNDEVREHFKQRLSDVKLEINHESKRFIYRKSLSIWVTGPIIAILLWAFYQDGFEFAGTLKLIPVALLIDGLFLGSFPFTWYRQHGSKITKYYFFIQVGKVDLSLVKAYSWSRMFGSRSRPILYSLILYDLNLRRLANLPVKTYNFPNSTNKVVEQALEVPANLCI